MKQGPLFKRKGPLFQSEFQSESFNPADTVSFESLDGIAHQVAGRTCTSISSVRGAPRARIALIDNRLPAVADPAIGLNVTVTSVPLGLRRRALCSELTSGVSIHSPGIEGSPKPATVLARPEKTGAAALARSVACAADCAAATGSAATAAVASGFSAESGAPGSDAPRSDVPCGTGSVFAEPPKPPPRMSEFHCRLLQAASNVAELRIKNIFFILKD